MLKLISLCYIVISGFYKPHFTVHLYYDSVEYLHDNSGLLLEQMSDFI